MFADGSRSGKLIGCVFFSPGRVHKIEINAGSFERNRFRPASIRSKLTSILRGMMDMSFGRLRRSFCLQVLVLAMIILAAGIGRAEEIETKSEKPNTELDTEHIFGFTEGTDIGEKGEREIESTFIGSIGKIGSYADVSNETAFRYNVDERLRLSFGTLTDFYSILDVPDLANRTTFGFSGFDAEARFVILDRHSAPFGMDLSINPQWRRLDDVSGANTQSYAIPMTLLIDKEAVPGKIFTAANFTYTPAITRTAGVWQHEESFETSFAASGVVAPNILLGAELRYLALAENGTFNGQALFAGPSLFAKLSDSLQAKIAWSAQISDLSKRGLDLENFERHQIILLVAYTF